MTDDRIIDLRPYLEGDDLVDEPPLSLWGTEGDRRRFILPLWRMSFLASARWGGLVRENGPGDLEVMVVVDQREDPARSVPARPLPELTTDDVPPSVRETAEGDVVVSVGYGPRGLRWVVVLSDRDSQNDPDVDRPILDDEREDMVYLSGECAGLIELTER